MPRPLARAAALATALACALGAGALSAVPAVAAAGLDPFVSEIHADSTGADHFEFIEVHNPGTQPVTFPEGEVFRYAYTDGADTSDDVPLSLAEDVTVAAGGTTVFWLSYTSSDGAVDSFDHDLADFRSHYEIDDQVPVHRVTGQAGMANGGNRAVRLVVDGEVLNWSYYPSGSMAAGLGVDFRLPADADDPLYPVLATQVSPTPGSVSAEALVPADSDGEAGPEPAPEPHPDPDLVTAPLQITELLPDSSNVGGADGFEFIEIYNATSEPVDLGDYSLVYLYPQDEQTNSNEATWPLVPEDVTVEPGHTVVVWVKNGANDDLGAADFNDMFGTDLELGRNLVEVFSGGMANGSPRGMAIRTDTGFDVNRAYYNMTDADDTAPDIGIRYGADTADLLVQRMLEPAPASPGLVHSDQVPTGLMVAPTDTSAPQVQDDTPAEVTPGADFTVDLTITDDVQVRSVTLELHNSADADPVVTSLLHGTDDTYTYRVHAADLTGKSWLEYTVTVSDGTHQITTDARRVPVAGQSTEPVHLNVTDDQFVSGVTSLNAAGQDFPATLRMEVDEQQVDTSPTLAGQPVFVFEVSQTDYYFRNGVRIGEDVLMIFDEGTYSETETMSTAVPLEYVHTDEDLVVSVWAGTKAGPWIDENENNDDFVISGMRLVLPDGRTLRPAGYDDPTELINMGDSPGKLDFYDAVFSLPDDAFTAVAHEWDTTTVADGPHQVHATDGENDANARVLVDNTAPEVTPSVQDGATYQGPFTLDATVADGDGSGVAAVSAALDDVPIELPHQTSSAELAAGEHVLTITATDEMGNETETTTTFLVPEEQPSGTALAPADGAEVPAGEVTLRAEVDDPTGDEVQVTFVEGDVVRLGDEDMVATGGTVTDAAAVQRSADPEVTASELAATAGLDPVSSDDALPYYQFQVAVPAGADTAQARLTWTGTANEGASVILSALTADGESWVEVDRLRSQSDGEQVELAGLVPVADHAADGQITALVQHSEGFAGTPLSSRTDEVTSAHPEDTPRSDYDFTFAWESDTQYYNEEFYDHQVAIHDYLLAQREAINLQYVFHTGDIVDDYDQPYQWENADQQYARFDEAGLPYGVLAGNHDVGSAASDYSEYSKYFGTERYEQNPWYGGSFEDNRGHYDLISTGGIDFLMLYMGWDPQPEAIDWMNEVLATYPDRVAIINLHEFMLTTGGLGPIPQQILDEVVATNPNVRMVFSGHYHDAFTRVDSFDDDGDGTPDRNVYAMLFDYQALPEGGLGYLRLLQFDNEGEQMRVRTYSPSLEQYNSEDPGLLGPEDDPYAYQDFVISYDELRIAPRTRTISTAAFTAEFLSDTTIAEVADVPTPSVVEATWQLDELGEHGWYVRTEDDHGGVHLSPVTTLTVLAPDGDDGSADDGTGGTGGGGTGDGTGGGSGGTGGGSGDHRDDGAADVAEEDSAADSPTGEQDGADAADPGAHPSGSMPVTGTGALALLGFAAAALAAGAALLWRHRAANR
ncbi:lamin tail domain-containing protein [Ruania albidiflava]|uniref:lamin tail domain-containing protein n=1 Tax=Ruania albidiflava TaxID=366586 RepID=UPI0023F234F5|nr:lamin tail domain-containing protein [Ruania albidiflava]